MPTLTLGIPGNSVAAALLGGLLIHGLIPGPELFTKHGVVTYGFILSMFLANITFLCLGLFFAPYFARISLIPIPLLIPGVCLFSMLGSYAMNNSVFDVYVMLFFAVAALLLEKGGFSLGALILGLILGPIAETGFAQGLIIGHGSISVFFTRTPSQILWAVIILLLVPPVLQVYRNHFGKKQESVVSTPTEKRVRRGIEPRH